METHILFSKKKCYVGALPESFDQYCLDNNRLFCAICNKLHSFKSPCSHILSNIQPLVVGLSDGEIDFNLQNIQSPTTVSFDTLSQRAELPGQTDSGYLGMTAASGLEDISIDDSPREAVSDGLLDSPTPVLVQYDYVDALNRVLGQPVDCVKAIPLKARRAAADTFSRLLLKVTRNPKDFEAHSKLFLFTPFVLARVGKTTKKVNSTIKRKAREILEMSVEEIVRIIEEGGAEKTEVKPKANNIKAVKRLMCLGRYSDAIKMLNSAGVHEVTQRIINVLIEKHPQVDEVECPKLTVQRYSFSPDEVALTLNRFTNGSTGGPYGLTERFLKDFIGDPQMGQIVLGALGDFCGLLMSGIFPVELAQFYASGRLIPLRKKDDGIRPMAVGETLRRLACKLALLVHFDKDTSILKPHQYGVGVPNGAEAIVHSVASIQETLADDEGILQIDFTNAFNLVNRDRMFALVKEHYPALSNLVNYLYMNQGTLKVGSKGQNNLKSCVGVQQGCPLGPFLFSLVLRVLILKIESQVPGLKLNLWYLDDGHIVGKFSDLVRCMQIITEFGPELGLFVNQSKCVIYGKVPDNFPSDVIRAVDGIMVIGSPIGNRDFVAKMVNAKVCAAAKTLFKSQSLEDPQKELLLLRCCSGAPKMVYWVRTCVPEFIQEELAGFDRVIDDSLQHILGVPVTAEYRNIIHLPLSMGGLGIPKVGIGADAAFVASVGYSWGLQKSGLIRFGYRDAVLRLTSRGAEVPEINDGLLDTPTLTTTKGFSQTGFMAVLNQKILDDTLLVADAKRKIIIRGRMCKGASRWLTVTPNKWSNSEFNASCFRALIKYSINMPLMSQECKCPDCGKIQDRFGHHALACKVASGAIDKHNSIVNWISLEMTRANIAHVKETGNPMSNTRQRPGDIFMNEFDIYGDAYFDVSVINPCAESYWKRAVKGSLEGANIRYEEKMKKYPELGGLFKPLVVEATGGWHAYSFDFLKKIAGHISGRTGVLTSDALNSILCGTSVKLQRHQGTMLVRRCLGL